MEDKDHLKEILGSINQINEPIDLEDIILKKIAAQESSKVQIARYKANGIKALWVSGVLIVVLGILFSLPSNARTVEHSIVTYTSVSLILLLLFIQLEIASKRIFRRLKNNLL